MTRRQLYRQDQKNMLLYAQREGTVLGMQQGMQEGIQKGMQQGMQQGMQKGVRKGHEEAMREVARTSLRRGLSPDLVASITGLSLAQIEKLRKGNGTRARKTRRRAVTA